MSLNSSRKSGETTHVTPKSQNTAKRVAETSFRAQLSGGDKSLQIVLQHFAGHALWELVNKNDVSWLLVVG